jgi:hypothetical protein
MRRVPTWVWLAATLTLSACASNGGSQAPTPPPPTSAVAAVPTVNPDAQAAVDAAMRDVAAHLGVDLSAVRVDQVEPRQWSDSSLGCPQPGNLYAQIVTPGFLIIISSSTKQLEYHSDARGHVVLCRET